MKSRSRTAFKFALVGAALVELILPSTSQEPPDPSDGPSIVVASLDFQRFQDNILELASFGDRYQGTQSYDSAEAWVSRQLQRMGYVVEYHDYMLLGQWRRNMYVTKVGTLFPDYMYIVSAHLDGRGGGGAADDDASGAALVLEAALAFSPPNIETQISIRFVFWNNEEQGPAFGSQRYVEDRQGLQGIEIPPGSRTYPEPTWLGIIQHDMILFDHGLPPQPNQILGADLDVEYRSHTDFGLQSRLLAGTLVAANSTYALRYPAEIGPDMCCTDSYSFRNFTAAVSVRENRRMTELANGSNPHWHGPTDVFSTYSYDDFRLGYDALRMTVGTVAELAVTGVVDAGHQ